MTLVADFNPSVSVPFSRMRQLLLEQGGGIQEGVVGANDLKVAQRGAGANMSVDVPAGAAWVQIDTGTRNGLGHVYNDATANVVVSASSGTNPRIDQIVLRWNDTSIPTGSGNVPTLEVLTGTATAGTTLDTRVGATALPNDCLRLADILVPTSSTSVTTANIRDRRPWSSGAKRTLRWLPAATNAPATTTSMNAALVTRMECTGVPVRVDFVVYVFGSGVFTVQPRMDGAVIDGHMWRIGALTAVGDVLTGWAETTPAAGSHIFEPYWLGTATATIGGAAGSSPALFTVQETLPDAGNG